MKVEYKWTKERFLEANKANYDLEMSKLKLRLLAYFGIVFVCFGAYMFWLKGVYTTLVVACALVVYWYVLRWPLYKLQLSANFKKHISKDKTLSWTIDTESFSITSENGGGSYKWSAVSDISESKSGFLVRQYPVFYWLPKDSFESEDDIERFRNEILSKVSNEKQT